MNKADLAAAVAVKTGMKKKDAEKAVAAFTDVITEALAGGEKVALAGLGTFEVRERAARTGKNPRTGESVEIASARAPKFRAGKALKDAVK